MSTAVIMPGSVSGTMEKNNNNYHCFDGFQTSGPTGSLSGTVDNDNDNSFHCYEGFQSPESVENNNSSYHCFDGFRSPENCQCRCRHSLHYHDSFLLTAIAFLDRKPIQCGSSTVAIDNKIEQAMDLVKSHLMFAVREEVEVLKEQIAELIERNNQLEYENNILRAAASPETLAKLAQPRQQPPPPSS